MEKLELMRVVLTLPTTLTLPPEPMAFVEIFWNNTEMKMFGQVHKMPEDLRKAITSSSAARAVWDDITPLARNEWICWITSGKKAETRGIRIKKALSKLKGGMRRPCCWAGCPHR